MLITQTSVWREEYQDEVEEAGLVTHDERTGKGIDTMAETTAGMQVEAGQGWW